MTEEQKTQEEEVLEEEVEEKEVEELLEEAEGTEEQEEEILTTVTVGDKEYDLDKTGRSQAEQISNIIGWLSQYGNNISEEITDEEGNISLSRNPFEVLAMMNKILSTDAMIELFVVVIGCTEEEAEEHFDIITLIDGVQAVLQQERYRKVITRFFSNA